MFGFVYLTFLKLRKQIQMELLLHNVIFNGLAYIFKSLKSIQWMKNIQKHFENIIISVFKQLKDL
jgi:hypothetical protein